jgi:selenocysteine lyase/cysteine desulfurase
MDDVEVRIDELRGTFAATLGTDLELVAVAHSTTEAVVRAALGITLQRGDRILLVDEEYPAVRGSIALLAQRSGVEIVTVSARDGAGRPLSDDEFVARTLPLLESPTRLAIISRVSWISGRVAPVAPILARARETGALTILDGAQSVGARIDPIDTLDPDLLAFPSQKWLLGIEGLAGVRLSRRALGSNGFNPVIGGFLAFVDQPMNGVGRLRDDARRMQTSGFARPDLVGAARAAGWLAMQVGLPWATARGDRLAGTFYAAIAAIDGVEPLARPEQRSQIVALRIRGWEAHQLVEELGARAFAIVRRVPGLPALLAGPGTPEGAPASGPALRTSWGFWNTDEEVARMVELITLFAAHTPETLPKRPKIDILHG